MMKTKWLVRAVSSLLALVMLFTAVPPTAFAVEKVQAYGDLNGDGKIDVRDVLSFQKYLLDVEDPTTNIKYADVNGDGVADLKDLNLSSDAELLEDYRGNSLLVFSSFWSIDYTINRNHGLVLAETLQR
jgi:hypothetical protein